MHNIEIYKAELLIYILSIIVIGVVLLAIGNLLFVVLKLCNLFHERIVWILSNIIGVAILIVSIIPSSVDIFQSSYCTIENVVKIEFDFKTKFREYVLITNQDGKVYTCYNYLIDTEEQKNFQFPVTVVYAQHSKLVLEIQNK